MSWEGKPHGYVSQSLQVGDGRRHHLAGERPGVGIGARANDASGKAAANLAQLHQKGNLSFAAEHQRRPQVAGPRDSALLEGPGHGKLGILQKCAPNQPGFDFQADKEANTGSP